jgi:hypothetical protein
MLASNTRSRREVCVFLHPVLCSAHIVVFAYFSTVTVSLDVRDGNGTVFAFMSRADLDTELWRQKEAARNSLPHRHNCVVRSGRCYSRVEVSVSDLGKASDFSPSVTFVHGLQGHPRSTWCSKDASFSTTDDTSRHGSDAVESSPGLFSFRTIFSQNPRTSPDKHPSSTPAEPKGPFWPEDFLPYECPRARIMTWGYNSKVTNLFCGPANRNTFYDHAGDLLLALHRKRRDNVRNPQV